MLGETDAVVYAAEAVDTVWRSVRIWWDYGVVGLDGRTEEVCDHHVLCQRLFCTNSDYSMHQLARCHLQEYFLRFLTDWLPRIQRLKTRRSSILLSPRPFFLNVMKQSDHIPQAASIIGKSASWLGIRLT
jgi:hypothetical protein